MPELLPYIILGVIQGVTEFLPISSSGHLVIAQNLLGLNTEGIWLEVCLHFGTLLAIFIVFRSQISSLICDCIKGLKELARQKPIEEIKEQAPLVPIALAIIIGTIPAAAAGILLHDYIRQAFEGNLLFVGSMLSITGLLLFGSHFASEGNYKEVGGLKGLLIGIAQAISLLPGISRSGITIVTGYFLGIKRNRAAEFSFLLAIPALTGALGLKVIRILTINAELQTLTKADPFAILIGTIAAIITGWFSLRLLLGIIKKGNLYWFGFYCLPAGILIIIFQLF